MQDLDIVIPVYNEGDKITEVLELLCKKVTARSRILICYDFEEDNTLPYVRDFVAQKRTDSVEIVLVCNTGCGGHEAIMTGFSKSSAKAVLVYMADDLQNMDLIDSMLTKISTGKDIVSASRFIPGGEMVGCPWLKAIMVRMAAFTLYYLAAVPCRDPTNSFRMFSRRIIDTITIETRDGFAFSLELLVKVHRLGWGVEEVPARWIERDLDNSQSRFKVLKWLPQYLQWYFYAFATTYLLRPSKSVPRQFPDRFQEHMNSD